MTKLTIADIFYFSERFLSIGGKEKLVPEEVLSLEGLDAKITALRYLVNATVAERKDLSQQVSELGHAIYDANAKLIGRMTSLEGRMTSLEGRMTSLEGRMTSLEEKMDKIIRHFGIE